MAFNNVGAILSFAIFFCIFSSILFFGIRYLQKKWITQVNWSERNAKLLKLISWTMLGLLFASFPIRLLPISQTIAATVAWVSYSIMGFLALLISLTAVIHLYQFLKEKYQSNTQTKANKLSRKEFLKSSLAFPILGLTSSAKASGIFTARKPEIIEQDIFLKRLPSEFDGYRIAQISDLHVGLTIRRDFVEEVVALTNEAEPDSITLTGDIMDGTVPLLADDMEPIKQLKAKDNVYFITGNHEYYSGALPWVEYFANAGFITLLNENHVIKRGDAQIAMCGINDRSAHRIIPDHQSDAFKATENLPPGMCKVMLAHQPRSVYDVEKVDCDLMLSGHTHGGQFFPWSLLVYFAHPYVKGYYDHDGMKVYVNQGTGYWGPPLRLGTKSEITMITLRKEVDSDAAVSP